MEAIRHIVTPKTTKLEIIIPDSLVDEKLEIIILPAGVTEEHNNSLYHSLMGQLQREEAEKMLAHVQQSRNEWR